MRLSGSVIPLPRKTQENIFHDLSTPVKETHSYRKKQKCSVTHCVCFFKNSVKNVFIPMSVSIWRHVHKRVTLTPAPDQDEQVNDMAL